MDPNGPTASFWTDMGDTLFPPERVAAADGEVQALSTLLAIDRPLDVLDMPCGVGRHSIAWARRGHRVTGVDLTESYLERARSAAATAGLPTANAAGAIRWVHQDMGTFDGRGSFDLVTNLWTSFGYGGVREDDESVASAFFGALRPGGRLVMDLAGKEVVVRRFQTHRWHPRADGVIVLEEARVVDSWRSIDMRWLSITPGQGERPTTMLDSTTRLRLYSAQELVDLLERVGFRECQVFGSAAGAPYDQDATRLVVVAIRP